MLIPLIFIIALMAALTGALLEQSLAAAKSVMHRASSRYADIAIGDGVADLTAGLAAFVARHGSGGPWPRATSRSAARSVCAGTAGAECPFRYVISASITAASSDPSTDLPGTADGAVNLQAAVINEQRVSATVTATVVGADGTVVATRSRFLTYRVFAAAPYAIVAGSRDITSVGGEESAAGADSGGAPASAGTFADTRIHVRLSCATIINDVVPFANDQQPAGNDGLPWGNAAHSAYEAPCTSADAPADVFRDRRWFNGDANRSGWTQ